MKKLLIISAIVGIVALSSNQSNAQVSLNVNIGTQPAWVPVGYQDVNYYYLPEVQSYYYVPQRQFVYLNGNRWTRSRNLPARYRGYNLSHGRKIVVHGNNPYNNYSTHRTQYANHSNYRRVSYGGGNRQMYNAPRNNYQPRNSYKQQRNNYKQHDYRGNSKGNNGRGNGNGRSHQGGRH